MSWTINSDGVPTAWSIFSLTQPVLDPPTTNQALAEDFPSDSAWMTEPSKWRRIVAAYHRNRPESQLGSRIDSLDVRGQQVSFLDRHERGQDDDETRGVVLDRRVDPLASFGQDRWPWIGKRQIRGSCRADRRIGARRRVLESRVLDASLVVDVFEPKPTFVAHEVPLGLWVFPRA